MIQPEERERLAESGLAAIAADQHRTTADIEALPMTQMHYLATDTVIDTGWYLHSRGFTHDEIIEILHEGIDRFDTEYKLPEGD